MANGKLLLGLGALAFISYRVWNAKESIKFFQYSFSGVKFGMQGISPVVTLSVKVYNPNRTGIPVNEVFGVIKAPDGGILANFKNVNAIQLAGNESAVIDLRSEVNALGIIIRLIQGKLQLPFVRIEAMLKTGLFDMPLNNQVSLKF